MTLQEMLAAAHAAADELGPRDAGAAALIVDVREPAEWAAEHIPDALNVPRGWLELHADRSSPIADTRLTGCRDRPVLVYCTQAPGVRSWLAALTLRQLGFADVAVLAGGLAGWRDAGLPVATASG